MPARKDSLLTIDYCRAPNARRFYTPYALTDCSYRDRIDKKDPNNRPFIGFLADDTCRLIHELHNVDEVKTIAVTAGKSPFVEVKLYDEYGWEEHDVIEKVVEVIEEHLEWCDVYCFRRPQSDYNEPNKKQKEGK